jgi:hypothetical protein
MTEDISSLLLYVEMVLQFAAANKWGNFWSVGAAWNLERIIFQKIEWINELKLRGSFGEVGNDSHISYGGLNYYIGALLFIRIE